MFVSKSLFTNQALRSALKKGEMLRIMASSLIVALLFLSLFVFAFTIQPAKAQSGTIIINPNGSISSPVPANITTSNNVTYTFTGNNYLPIVVNRSNIIIDGMGHTLQASGSYDGFSLSSVSNVTIENTTIKNGAIGIYLDYSNDNTLSGNNVTAHTYGYGIDLQFSSDNTLSGNNVTINSYGIVLSNSSNNVFSRNNVTASIFDGVDLYYSSNNTLSGNNVTANSDYGVYLYYSSNNTLSGNTVTANGYGGINLESCDNNTLSGNTVTANSGNGVDLYGSSGNTLSGNTVTGNSGNGFFLWNCDNNTLSGNTITGNSYDGIYLYSSSDNTFYHNNFTNNTQQVSSDGSPNTWDNGYPSGGNYWSDYTGVDQKSGPYQNVTGSDGIGDTPYVIDANNTDRYPLMGPFHTFGVGTWNGVAYSVDTVSNSTITNLSFNQPAKTLTFNVTGTSGTVGFCRVAIPKTLMSGSWTVIVNGTSISYSTTTDVNYTYIYFTYHHSTETVQIISTSVIPEFQPSMLIPLFMIITLLGAMIFKRKRNADR
jgi:parallel beta-helix repeat protein